MKFYGYDIDPARLPKHIGIIMDGNGRWAQKRGLDRGEGHEKGFLALKRLMEFNKKMKVETLSVYAFSTENWKRPEREVTGLMNLLRRVIPMYAEELAANDIRMIVTGTREGLPPDLGRMLDKAMEITSQCKRFTFNVAFNYGGRREISDAVRSIVRDVKAGKLDESAIDESVVGRYVYTPQLPDVDLMIRTSGERRISNFLLWQGSYAELWFTGKLWPDFGARDYCRAIYDFQNRHRRFGNV